MVGASVERTGFVALASLFSGVVGKFWRWWGTGKALVRPMVCGRG